MVDDLPALLARWRRFRRALGVDDHATMDRLIAVAERRGPALARVIDDPLEAAVLAVLIELARERA